MVEANKKKTDDEIALIVSQAIDNSTGGEDTGMSRERQTVRDAYDGKTPKKRNAGSSGYVSLDVYDSVEAMYAQLLETFSGNNQPVVFTPDSASSVQTCEAQTAYCQHVIFELNDGRELFSSVIQDGLMARAGIAKACWYEEEEMEEIQITQPVQQQVAAAYLAQNPKAQITQNPDGTFNLSQTKKIKKAYAKISSVPPEKFGISPKARSLDEAEWTWHKELMSAGEMKAAGIPDAKVDAVIEKLGTKDTRGQEHLIEEADRFRDIDEGFLSDQISNIDKAWVYEVYMKADFDGSGYEKMWKVWYAEDTLLDKEIVKRHPFVAFVPIPIPHSFYGVNWALNIVQTQNSKTMLMRAVMEHTGTSIVPRWLVLNGSVPNPQEILDPRLGGLINATRADAVTPLPQNPLNPFVPNILQMLDTRLDWNRGISALSQGLNKDALSHQNSAALVEQLTSNGQVRQKVIARNFAYGFLIPLYKLVSDLVIENEDRQRIVQVAGSWQEVNPSDWESGRSMTTTIQLGYNEAERETQKLLMFHGLWSQDPEMKTQYSSQQKYNLMGKVLKMNGMPDVSSYLNPNPPPDPMAQAQMELEKQKLQLEQQKLEVQKLALQVEMAKIQQAGQQDQNDTIIDAHDKDAKNAIAERKVAVEEKRQEVDEYVAKAEVEAMQQAEATDRFNAIASPSGR